MSKIEVLATSVILTLTVISTAPLKIADVNLDIEFAKNKGNIEKNKEISYNLANKSIINRQEKVDKEAITFLLSHTLDSIYSKIEFKNWQEAKLNLLETSLLKNKLIKRTHSKIKTSAKVLKGLTFGVTNNAIDNLSNEFTLQESNIDNFTFDTWTQNKIDNLVEYQKVWTANLNSAEIAEKESKIELSAKSLPIVSLIIASVFCFFSAKKQDNIEN